MHNWKFKKIIGFSVLGALLLCIAIAWAMIPYALSKNLADGRRDEAQAEERYRRDYPTQTAWLDSLQACGALRDTFILASGGERLHAKYIPASRPSNRSALLIHGYTDCLWGMMPYAYMYHHDLGFNILLPDGYAHGLSQGSHIRMGWLDRHDVLQWMALANDMFKGDSLATQMLLHGVSMGAATTMMVSGEAQAPYVKCFVEDCGYTSVWDEFAHELKSRFGLPPFPFLHLSGLLNQMIHGWGFKEASALAQVSKCQLPMMFIHGDKDDFVPTWMIYPLYEAKSGDKEMWLSPGVDHARSYKMYPEEYTRRVEAFVSKYIY
ncbi:MAG: alpha/beta hydrolase [Bacteroidales bacterium]|nr:alpha/beta hydrolase [Bacteroidales bacterium]